MATFDLTNFPLDGLIVSVIGFEINDLPNLLQIRFDQQMIIRALLTCCQQCNASSVGRFGGICLPNCLATSLA